MFNLGYQMHEQKHASYCNIYLFLGWYIEISSSAQKPAKW